LWRLRLLHQVKLSKGSAMKLSIFVLKAQRMRFAVASVGALALVSAFAIAGLVLPASVASAATVDISQCNNQGASAEGATTRMNCTVTVVNTINGTTTNSTTTVTRQCELGPCSSPNGTFTTSSTNLVTSVTQCNGSDNDAAHPINCDVTITNNISANTPGAEPATAATVNQCVGSAQGGGGIVNCDPFPATTTSATVTQCNGSGNGGGGTVDCAVGTSSTVRPAIPITVNQCNGTGNPGGSVVTCRTNLVTNITAGTTPTTTAGTTPTTTAGTTPTTTAGTTPTTTAGTTPTTTATPTAAASAQVTQIPTGAVSSGDGSTSGGSDAQGLLVGALLFAGVGAAVVVAVRRRRLNT
jgi:hypothetical protein